MTKHALFLKWWLFFTAVCVGFIYAVSKGAIETLWDKDATKLSFVLLVLFGSVSAWCGYKTWMLSKFLDSGGEDEHIVEKIDHLMLFFGCCQSIVEIVFPIQFYCIQC